MRSLAKHQPVDCYFKQVDNAYLVGGFINWSQQYGHLNQASPLVEAQTEPNQKWYTHYMPMLDD